MIGGASFPRDPSPRGDASRGTGVADVPLLRTRGAWLALVAGLFLSGGARAQLLFEAARPHDERSASATPSPRATRVDQRLTFPPPPPKVHRDPDFTLRASSTSGLRVHFTASGDCSIRGATVHLLSAGNCWRTAHQPGNERYGAAVEVVRWLRMEKDG